MGIRTASAALALAGMLSTGQSWADVQGRASLGNLRVTLFDLDLSDAVTPSITLSFPSGPSTLPTVGSAHLTYRADSEHFSEGYGKYQAAESDRPMTLAYRHGSHAETAMQLEHPTPQGQALSVSNRLGPAGQHEFQLWASVYSDTLGIVLSPNTRAVFTTELAFAGTTSALSSHDQELMLQASMTAGDLLNTEYANDATTMRIGSLPGYLRALEDSDILSVAFSNSGDSERAGEVYFSLSLYATLTPLAPVPEPASYAMLLAGAALLGWRVGPRRRRGEFSKPCLQEER